MTEHMNPAEAHEAPAPDPKSAQIDELLQNGALNIAAAEAQPAKRGRGRPRKIPLAPGAEQASPASDPAAPVDPGPTMPDVDLQPILGKFAAMPFEIVAQRTQFPGFRLAQEEQDAIAPLLDQVLKQYAPNFGQSPHAPLGMLALSVAGLCYGKYTAYLDFKASEPEQRPAA